MKIGIFDSGLGGLVIAKAIFKRLPNYDYVYLGDTKNLPYGNKSQAKIFKLATGALRFLFRQNCRLVIIACNTASAKALRKIQRQFLPKFYPDKKVLGVIVPTIEEVVKLKGVNRVGVISTLSTAQSQAYKKEIAELHRGLKVYEQAAPKLVPLIEEGRTGEAGKALGVYLKPLLKKKIDALVLGCTHYPILKRQIKQAVGRKVKVVSQDEIVPQKLQSYLAKHKEISSLLSKNSKREFLVTNINKSLKSVSKKLFGKNLQFKLVRYLQSNLL